MIKLLYKPVDLIAGMVGGLLAGPIFKKGLEAHRPGETRLSPPMSGGAGGNPAGRDVAGRDLCAGQRPAVDRGAEGTRRLTGTWPGDEGHVPDETT
jgi:hypothetical protein